MLVFDRENWPYHRFWCWAVVVATGAAVLWYVAYGGLFGGSWQWPGGSSPPGFTFGVLGGAIIAFEMLLWPRKSLWRGWRLGRTKYWMTAHLWLGLLTLPLLILHGDFRFDPSRSTLAVVLMWLTVIVVFSGVLGAVIQNIVPRMMLDRVPAETIHAQIGHVLAQYRDEAEQLVQATSGSAQAAVESTPTPVETGRRIGRAGSMTVLEPATPRHVADSEALIAFHREHVEPYLAARSGAKSALASPRRAGALFQALKANLPDPAQAVADRLAELCDHRRQFDLQARLHAWLYTWLAVHVAISIALFVLMIFHIVMALKYV